MKGSAAPDNTRIARSATAGRMGALDSIQIVPQSNVLLQGVSRWIVVQL